MVEKSFSIDAPGRVFLFGEHSDYLGLEVISAALNKTITIDVKPNAEKQIHIKYTDLAEVDSFEISDNLIYRHKRDYVRSSLNVLKNNNIIPKNGASLEISGSIPIAAGLSSSSALSVASILTFSKLADVELNKEEVAQYAFEAEVLEFGESGGMMDHLASIFGGIIHVDFGHQFKITPLSTKITGLIIGDSLEKKKDTVGDLRMIRTNVEAGYNQLKNYIQGFDHRLTSLDDVLTHIGKISDSTSRMMTEATIRNRDLTREALQYLIEGAKEPNTFGKLIDRHHMLMKDGLRRSTKKIERMILAAKDAGALGGKINGSGGGGTMLAYAPGKEDDVANALEDVGGKPYIVKISDGASIRC